MPISALDRIRSRAIAQTISSQTSLKSAIERLGFVQADPIKSPAAAQDLILRQRVHSYSAGDLEQHYASLDIEEDYLYAYGFFPRQVWQLLHPRNATNLPKFERKVLETVRQLGQLHPRALEEHFGSERVVNAWGGYSKATTRALEYLHYRGLLRVARREKGIRIYEPLPPGKDASLPPVGKHERLEKLVLLVAQILAPVPQKSLQQTINKIRHTVPDASGIRTVVEDLLRSGMMEKQTVEGLAYVWPSEPSPARTVESAKGDDFDRVRILAPFDPVVWDRRRFEHLWGWAYRFEAYTPVAKRQRGYYAMPLLWREQIIGWANALVVEKRLQIEFGFVGKRPRDTLFREQLSLETERLQVFLKLPR